MKTGLAIMLALLHTYLLHRFLLELLRDSLKTLKSEIGRVIIIVTVLLIFAVFFPPEEKSRKISFIVRALLGTRKTTRYSTRAGHSVLKRTPNITKPVRPAFFLPTGRCHPGAKCS